MRRRVVKSAASKAHICNISAIAIVVFVQPNRPHTETMLEARKIRSPHAHVLVAVRKEQPAVAPTRPVRLLRACCLEHVPVVGARSIFRLVRDFDLGRRHVVPETFVSVLVVVTTRCVVLARNRAPPQVVFHLDKRALWVVRRHVKPSTVVVGRFGISQLYLKLCARHSHVGAWSRLVRRCALAAPAVGNVDHVPGFEQPKRARHPDPKRLARNGKQHAAVRLVKVFVRHHGSDRIEC